MSNKNGCASKTMQKRLEAPNSLKILRLHFNKDYHGCHFLQLKTWVSVFLVVSGCVMTIIPSKFLHVSCSCWTVVKFMFGDGRLKLIETNWMFRVLMVIKINLSCKLKSGNNLGAFVQNNLIYMGSLKK